MATKKPTKLDEALLAAQQAIGAIGKDGHNDFSNYDYVTAETMITRSREVLLEQGIVLTAGNVELIPFRDDALIVRQTMNLMFAADLNADKQLSAITRDWPAVAQKGRPIDKAVAGALTAGLSYMLRDLLLVPRGDEPGTGMDDPARDKVTQKPAPKARPKKAKAKASQELQHTGPHSTPSGVQGMVSTLIGEPEKGDMVRTAKGNVGRVFWMKEDRVGVRWGEGDDELEWTYVRFCTPYVPHDEHDEHEEADDNGEAPIPF